MIHFKQSPCFSKDFKCCIGIKFEYVVVQKKKGKLLANLPTQSILFVLFFSFHQIQKHNKIEKTLLQGWTDQDRQQTISNTKNKKQTVMTSWPLTLFLAGCKACGKWFIQINAALLWFIFFIFPFHLFTLSHTNPNNPNNTNVAPCMEETISGKANWWPVGSGDRTEDRRGLIRAALIWRTQTCGFYLSKCSKHEAIK